MVSIYPRELTVEATTLVTMVRDEDPAEVAMRVSDMNRVRLEQLAITLAAMVPDDVPLSRLLAWCDPDLEARVAESRRKEAARRAKVRRDAVPDRVLAPHGTHPAFNRHKAAGEKPCDLCVLGERTYQRERARRRRAVQAVA